MAPPRKDPATLRRRYTVSLDYYTDDIVKQLQELTGMYRSQLICWAIQHCWREIQEQNLGHEE